MVSLTKSLSRKVVSEGISLRGYCSLREKEEIERCVKLQEVYQDEDFEDEETEIGDIEEENSEVGEEQNFRSTTDTDDHSNGSDDSRIKRGTGTIGKAKDHASQTFRTPTGPNWYLYGGAMVCVFCFMICPAKADTNADTNPCREDPPEGKALETRLYRGEVSFTCLTEPHKIKLCADKKQFYNGYDNTDHSWLKVEKYDWGYVFTVSIGPDTPKSFSCLSVINGTYINISDPKGTRIEEPSTPATSSSMTSGGLKSGAGDATWSLYLLPMCLVSMYFFRG